MEWIAINLGIIIEFCRVYDFNEIKKIKTVFKRFFKRFFSCLF